MKKKLLITGATGFLGYHLIEEAHKSGYDIYAGIRFGSKADHLSPFNIKYLPLTYDNIDVLTKELERIQVNYIIHAAGSTKAKNEKVYNLINATYSQNLAQAANKANIDLKKFIFISSLAAVGPENNINGGAIEETLKPMPVTAYGKSKLLAENFLTEIKELPLIIFRPTAIYGQREKDIFIMLKSIASGIEAYIGNKEQKLSFVYAKDMAEIGIRSLSTSICNEVYHVSDGNVYGRYELAEITKTIIGNKTLKLHLPLGLVKTIASALDLVYIFSDKTPLLNRGKLNELTAVNWHCSIGKIQNELGFTPKYDLKQGLEETIKWYKTNNWL